MTSLSCLPYDFANSVGSDSLVQVIRTMAESATTETLAFLTKLVPWWNSLVLIVNRTVLQPD